MENNKQNIFVSPNKIGLIKPNLFSMARNINDIHKNKHNTTIQELLQFKNKNSTHIVNSNDLYTDNELIANNNHDINKIKNNKLINNTVIKSSNENPHNTSTKQLYVDKAYVHNTPTKQLQADNSKSASKLASSNRDIQSNSKYDINLNKTIPSSATINVLLKKDDNYESNNNSISSTNSKDNTKKKKIRLNIPLSSTKHTRKTIVDLENELLQKQKILRELEMKTLNNKLVVKSVLTHIDNNQIKYENEVKRLIYMINHAKQDLNKQYISSGSI